MSDVPSVDNQTVPRDSRRTGHARSPSDGPPGPSITLRTQSPQNTEGSRRNPSPTPFRNGLSRSGSPASSLRERRPPSIVVPHPAAALPTQQPRRPSNATSTSSHAPSLSMEMNLSRLASSIHVCTAFLGTAAHIFIVQLRKALL